MSEEEYEGSYSEPSYALQNAVKLLKLGLILLLASFAVKQVLVSWSLKHIGSPLEVPRLNMEKQSEIAELSVQDVLRP